MQLRRPTYPLRVVLMGVILSLVVLSMGAVGIVSYYFGSAELNALADTVVRQTVERVALRLEQFQQTAYLQNAECLGLSEGTHLTVADFERLALAIWPSLKAHAELARVYFGLEATGEFFAVERSDDGRVVLRIIADEPGGGRAERVYQHRPGGWELEKTLPFDGYDPRKRPFYEVARSAGGPTWTETYHFWLRQDDRHFGVSYASPMLSEAGRLLGVWSCDLDTDSLCSFLGSLQREVPGYAFIVEESASHQRRIIAHPNRALLRDPKTGWLWASVEAVDDQRLRAFMSLLPASFGTESRPEKRGPMAFQAGGEECFGSYTVAPEGPRWLIGMVLPQKEIIHNVHRYGVQFLVLFIGVLLAAATAIVWVSHRTTARLHQLHREAVAVGRLELEPGARGDSRILEIREVADAVESMKANLRSFRKYVPAEVVGELVRTGREACLGGRKIHTTVYFSDIAHFTATAERFEPEQLVEHLGQYLEAMSDGIARHGGTVDKFIGDAVMAFWNGLQERPTHALDACRAALDNQRVLVELRGRWRAAGRPLFHTRIGLHTGPVVVGNIGSERRMNYTIIGDSVNLTNRLEKLNKIYGTRVLLSESTFAEARKNVLARPLDCVGVQGKTRGVRVYELLGLRGEEDQAQAERCELSEAAVDLYLAGQFAAAAKAFHQILQLHPEDAPIKVLCRRCEGFASSPPDDWDGVFRLQG
jgi:adenylate cyclase